jgi:uncharacterized protein (DUF983 family)
MNNEKIPNKWLSIFKMKCPNCRKGNMYSNPSLLPLGKLLDMPEHCTVCGQKFEIQVGFWYGTGYISYALSVALITAVAVAFGVLYGFSWRDNSIFIFIGIMVVLLALMQPWIMRLSRVLYLYVFVKYGEGFQS